MISLVSVKRFCKEYWKIENYQEAVNDQTQTWHCHHRHEIDWVLSRKELIAMGRYYDVHYSELIFLTPREHNVLHNTGENNPMYGKECCWKGKHRTEESKAKMSNAKKGKYEGENNPNYKYHIPEEELYDLYILQGLQQKEISVIYGCSPTVIRHNLKKYNIIK